MNPAPLVRWIDRHSRAAWLVLALITAISVGGLARLRIATGMLEWLPTAHPNVAAFGRLAEDLPGAVNQELIWLELDPAKARRHGIESICDARALLAQEALLQFLRQQVPGIRGAFGVLPFVATVAGELSVGSDGVPVLPESEAAVDLLWSIVEHGPAGSFCTAFLTADRQATILALGLEGSPFDAEARRGGERLQEVLAAWKRERSPDHDLFCDEFLVTTGLASGTAWIDRVLKRDLGYLTPCALIFLGFVLRILLGCWRAVWAPLGVLLLGGLWTLGILGWTGTPLNVVTVAIIPLLLGCGIDYAVLISVEAAERQAEGRSANAVIDLLGRSSLTAVCLTVLTTSAGLFGLTFSDSPGIRALGFTAAVGMMILGGLNILILPIFHPWHVVPAQTSHRGGGLARLAQWISGHRIGVLVIWAVITLLCVPAAREPVISLDIIEGNFPLDSPVTRIVHRMRARCGGAFPELIMAHGDLAAPASMDILHRIADRLEASPRIGPEFDVVGVPDLIDLMRTRSLFRGQFATVTEDSDSIRKSVRQLWENPRWASIAGLVIDRECRSGTLLLMGGDAGNDPDQVRLLWEEIDTILAEECPANAPIEVSFLGYRTLSYLFITTTEFWIRVTIVVSQILVIVLTALILRDLRAVFVLALLMAGSTLWWFAGLRLAGIYLSLFLLFPLVFVLCIGTDYALHLFCRARAERRGKIRTLPAGSSARIWSTTGRAITVAAITDAGVFLIFSAMELVSGALVLRALAIAVLVAYATTWILIPALGWRESP